MNRYVKVKKQNFVYLMVCSLIFSLVITSLFFVGYTVFSKLEKDVYADNELSVASVEVVEERTIPVFKEVEVEYTVEPLSMRKVGAFRLTAYCPCSECCDQYGASPDGKHGAIGVGVYQGVTFAVDPKVIPYGTKMYIEGVGVGIASDCGGSIKGNRIDVYFRDHNEALVFGKGGGYAHNVYIIE